jgi:hypothetical protein
MLTITLCLFLAGIAMGSAFACVWAWGVRSGQFRDLVLRAIMPPAIKYRARATMSTVSFETPRTSAPAFGPSGLGAQGQFDAGLAIRTLPLNWRNTKAK